MEYLSIIAILLSIISPIINLLINEKIKAQVNHNFEKKIEAIKKENAIEISKFEKEIDYLKSNESFKFNRLHEKRLEVLERSYELINKLYFSLEKLLAPIKFTDGNENLSEKYYLDLDIAYKEFVIYFSQKKIYYDKEIEKIIEDFINKTKEASSDYYDHLLFKNIGITGEEMGNASIKAMYSYKKIPKILLPVKELIEDKFRDILGK